MTISGATIRGHLDLLGLSHRELAERIGVSRGRVTQICEAGVADEDLADRISVALGLDGPSAGSGSMLARFVDLPDVWPGDAAGRRLTVRLAKRLIETMHHIDADTLPAEIVISAAAGAWDPAHPERVGP